eukprot:Gregarina_sp_Poly_1__401@NODE_109_length_14014_cov_141_998351_g96_i0_p9_GENE_NODE_109_length_14014_cov_141_998351_g96_i0NODE_109_length_14014_cov_141_998351_g96_i0_p9_ORF_typecomplete_len117_score19_25DUF4229/PF14012_6/2_2DUF4229/PF14012_6/17_NODE_109_length_14014_cov_141_998351_g96_i088859235
MNYCGGGEIAAVVGVPSSFFFLPPPTRNQEDPPLLVLSFPLSPLALRPRDFGVAFGLRGGRSATAGFTGGIPAVLGDGDRDCDDALGFERPMSRPNPSLADQTVDPFVFNEELFPD